MRTLRRRRPPPAVRGSHWNLRTATIVPPSAHRAITPRSCQRKPLPVVKGLNVACIASAKCLTGKNPPSDWSHLGAVSSGKKIDDTNATGSQVKLAMAGAASPLGQTAASARPSAQKLTIPTSSVTIAARSRNISGNAMVKNAENGFRQNSRFWYQNWRASRDRAPGLRPRVALAAEPAAVLAAVSAIGGLLGGDGIGVAGELEVDVLEGRPRDRQGFQFLATADGPSGEQVERGGRRLGPEQHVAVLEPRLARQPAGQVGQCQGGRQPEADHRLGKIAAAQ